MNIEEAKKLIDKQSIGKGGVGDIPVVKTHIVKVLLDQLDKPKLEVPQMIFDVIKSFDDDVDYLHQHMSRQSDEVREWLTHNEREFYEAWLAYPNITIEKEKLYTVEIPNPNERQLSFVLMRQLSGNVSIKVMHRDNLDLLKTDNDLQLTESEIRKDFDWAWQFREEVVE
ncbi:TPA: DUF1642 domain-containing protein [Streptococcus agalactiae]|jgi:hypothetical protein|uniref:DUF1642 domain-containing protein n=1 Tax=Streptococcus TaxID=1301 RepID=UPI0007642650|nr:MULTISPECIES: DUF1642 domain-containing protein [Streptococcus]KXA53935.1 hypothetical protein HMPREF1885_02004 [Streptococcus agalactiae]MDU7888140.1 DUF1642 domain-containing protein [Streptococcus agalactiae]OFQ67443.1 hypothetical protein HMPREF2923_06890 [Streptococcus sp. HMSC078D02]WEB00645.1 DUF1642 domain-containing protein [Streptococcus agalactiae]HEN2808155.1 DUF1642 domain-containing protein [Streptococcus agalactiae]